MFLSPNLKNVLGRVGVSVPHVFGRFCAAAIRWETMIAVHPRVCVTRDFTALRVLLRTGSVRVLYRVFRKYFTRYDPLEFCKWKEKIRSRTNAICVVRSNSYVPHVTLLYPQEILFRVRIFRNHWSFPSLSAAFRILILPYSIRLSQRTIAYHKVSPAKLS